VPLESGLYTVVFEARIFDLKTTSVLKRLFVNKDEPREEKERLRWEYFEGLGVSPLSMAPPELATINFLIGEPPQNPLIEEDDFLVLVSTIENSMNGELVNVQGITFDFQGDFRIKDPACISPTVDLRGKTKERFIPHQTCILEITNPELQEPVHFIPREYEATMVYDYTLTQEIPITVAVVENT
jgi:hypothetical protein